MMEFDEKYCLESFARLLQADSTTGQYEQVQELLCRMLEELGCPYQVTHKGGVIADLGGEGKALAVTAHLDDIGLMVRKLNSDGTLQVCPVGGLYPFYCVTENVRVYTRDGKVFTGSVCRTPASIHVTEEELRSTLPDFRSNVCVVLDEDVHNADQVRALGVETGDLIALEPRFTLANGYLKSRFIDDKACVAVLLTAIKALRESGTGRSMPILPPMRRSATAQPGCRRAWRICWPSTSRPPGRTRTPTSARCPSSPRTPASPITGA